MTRKGLTNEEIIALIISEDTDLEKDSDLDEDPDLNEDSEMSENSNLDEDIDVHKDTDQCDIEIITYEFNQDDIYFILECQEDPQE